MSVTYGELAVVFQGLSLNAFEVVCDSSELSRFRVPEGTRKRDLRGRFGVGDVFIDDGWVYVAGPSSAHDSETVAMRPEDHEELLVFMLREALAQHARDRGLPVWFTMGAPIAAFER